MTLNAGNVLTLISKLRSAASSEWFIDLIALIKEDAPAAEQLFEQFIASDQAPAWLKAFTPAEVTLATRFLKVVEGFIGLV